MTPIMMEDYMIKCLLAQFYSSFGMKAEIFEKDTFDLDAMDKRWEELFEISMKDDPESCWELTDCEVEPLFEVSVDDESWKWQTGKRLWFNNYFKQIYVDHGQAEDFETALEAALDAFENMSIDMEVTDLENIDDDFE